ncbi:adhesive plaque matrix protein [Onychostoma macrolepis]|uniref:Adhesive plaque matrix protein-like n=1 Tax=Onychostoma macrolepis TaxID=369639 RepID=A0A7J6DHK0_9TELE|nr:adhesive plaque matrix protein [Onychostoma macrolepis]KAF4118465.1 hypothetical protein G5714_000516 [Onychostoma macrolepis]
MNKCGQLPVLCVLLLTFHGVLCSEFVRSKCALSKLKFHDEVSNGDIFKSFWRNSKQRRSVNFMGNGQQKTTEQTQTNKLQYECGDQILTVVLKHADAVNIRIYGRHGGQFEFDRLQAFCGVSIKTTNTELHLLFNYVSCYVKQESTKHVLSLSWYGTNLDLSCPVRVTPPSMVCKNKVMELTVFNGTADEMSVAVNGEWAPLLYVATQCWKRKLFNQRDLTFFVKHTSCGVTVGKSHFNLDLRLRDETITLSCSYEEILVLPPKNSWLSVTNQPLPQRELNVYHKPSTGFPTKAIASQVVEEQAFPVEQPARNAASSPSLHRRSHSLPKLPSLPGSFNLAVNFPFSLPVPTRHANRGHLISKPVTPTPEPTYTPIPDPTYSSSEFSSSVQNGQPHVSYEQEEIAVPVTEAPKSEYQYMQYPYKFEKPASPSSQTEPSPALESQLSRGPVSSAALYQPYGSAQNFPKLNPLQVNPSLASLVQYIPPGYFLCSYDSQQPPIHPHMFQPSDPNQPLQYQKPDIAQLVNPAVPPKKGYPEQQLTSAVASSPHDSGTPLFQPSQFQQYLYQSSYGRQSSTTPLSPTLPHIPINLQPQTRPNPAFQDSRPLQSQYYQKPSQPLGSVQQPWSISHFPVRGLSERSRPFMSTSSQPPELLQYQTGGNQYLDPYQRSVVYTPGTGTSSHSQYQPSPFSYPPFRPEISSADVSTENMGSSPSFFQPRSKAPVSSSRAPNKSKHPIASLPPPVHRPLWGKPEKHVAKLPLSQGPSVRYKQNPHVHPERPSETRSPKPQNDTMPLRQFFRQASIPKDVYVPPHFRSTSQ